MHPASSSWNETAAGTDSGATATHAAAAGKMHFAEHISGHSDADSIIQIIEDGSTVLWETKLVTAQNGNGFAVNVPRGIHAQPGLSIAGKVVSSSSDCQVNLAGFSIP